MVATDAIRNLIREDNTHQIPTMIEAGASFGMITMDRALVNLFKKGRISRETVMLNAKKPDEIKRFMT